MTLEEKSSVKVFNGQQKTFSHFSKYCNCIMTFAIYLPEQISAKKCHVVYWLSGLTCNEQNAITKSGLQRSASKLGLVIVCPDTSPRGEGVPDEPDAWDFGMGAGFYVDATQDPWKKNYQMYSYVTNELPSLIEANFPVLADKAGIMGHSMGGHGAFICALRNPGKYRSVSAFAPICHPSKCPWGLKAFGCYLGSSSPESWKEFDAVELVKSGHRFSGPVLVDQGDKDNFLSAGQLLPEELVTVCSAHNIPLTLHMQKDYDHSYYFVASFMDAHLEFHAKNLSEAGSGE